MILVATSSINSAPPAEIIVHTKAFENSTSKNDVTGRKGLAGHKSPDKTQGDSAAASPMLDKIEKSKAQVDGTITRTDCGEPE